MRSVFLILLLFFLTYIHEIKKVKSVVADSPETSDTNISRGGKEYLETDTILLQVSKFTY